MANDNSYPSPINRPQRNINLIRKPIPLPIRPMAGESHDRREVQKLKVRFDVEARHSPFIDDPNHSIQSPEDKWIEVDSADDIIQNYTVPPSGGSYGQFTQLRYAIDRANKVLVVYHFDHQNLKWMKFVTRLRKDVELPRPPAMQMVHNAVYVYGSRGRRYIRQKQKITDVRRRQYLSNRLYKNISGVSGSRYSTGAFR